MDYSLLVGIHDVERAEQEDVECEENDGEEEGESDGTHPIGTPPDSPRNTLNSSPPLAPGEFDPNIDVYGIKCHESKLSYSQLFSPAVRFVHCYLPVITTPVESIVSCRPRSPESRVPVD